MNNKAEIEKKYNVILSEYKKHLKKYNVKIYKNLIVIIFYMKKI